MGEIKLFQAISNADKNNFNSSHLITPYFYEPGKGTEYDLFKKINGDENPDTPWGLISSKFSLKSHITINDFYKFALDEFDKSCDCVFTNPMIGNEALFLNVWEQGRTVGHQGIEKIYQHLIEVDFVNKIDYMGVESFAFCNYFIGNNKFWKSYFNYIDNILSHLNLQNLNNTEIGKIYNGPGNYHKNTSMTLKPFITERLFSSFISTATKEGLEIKAFIPNELHYIEKFGENYGQLLFRLSNLKNKKPINNENLNLWNDIRNNIISNKAIFLGLLHFDDPDAELLQISNILRKYQKS
jgi:hypothetical protein